MGLLHLRTQQIGISNFIKEIIMINIIILFVFIIITTLAYAQLTPDAIKALQNQLQDDQNIIDVDNSIINKDDAVYSHWRQSVVDYALWQSLVQNPENIRSESNWIDYINKYYSKDNSYKTKLLQIKKNL